MLFKILDNIRSKPKHIRDQYAFGVAVLCTFVIGGIWSLSLPARFSSDSQVATLASTTNAVPFANFFTQLKNQFSGITEAIAELPQATSTNTSVESSTDEALNLHLSEENKQQLLASSSATKIEFGTSSSMHHHTEVAPKNTIILGTTSDMSEHAH
jgi:hypothetical protein